MLLQEKAVLADIVTVKKSTLSDPAIFNALLAADVKIILNKTRKRETMRNAKATVRKHPCSNCGKNFFIDGFCSYCYPETLDLPFTAHSVDDRGGLFGPRVEMKSHEQLVREGHLSYEING